MGDYDLRELVLETRRDLDRWIERGRRAQAAAGRGDWATVRAELEARRFLQEQVSARLQRLQAGALDGGLAALGADPAGGQWLAQLEEHLQRALEADQELRLSLAVRHETLGERVRFLEQARRAVAAYARQARQPGQASPGGRPGVASQASAAGQVPRPGPQGPEGEARHGEEREAGSSDMR